MAARYMLDTDAIVRLSESHATSLLVAQRVNEGAIEILTTHVQVDELVRVRDHEALARRLLVLLRVRARLVSTSIFVLDVNRLDLARLGSAEANAGYGRHLGDGTARGRHAEDAVIASTARAEDAALVTLNRRDRNRFKRGQPDLRLLDWDEFSSEPAP